VHLSSALSLWRFIDAPTGRQHRLSILIFAVSAFLRPPIHVEPAYSRSRMTRRIVITSLGSYGDVNPYMGLAIGLRDRGYEPVIATSEFYRSYVEREGIAFHPVRPNVDPDDRALVARVMDP